jgi:hypothetical protein
LDVGLRKKVRHRLHRVREQRCLAYQQFHCLFPLPECPSWYAVAYVQLVRLRRRATRFLIRNYLGYVAFGS